MSTVLNLTTQADGHILASDNRSVRLIRGDIRRAPEGAAAADQHIYGVLAPGDAPIWVVFAADEVVCPYRKGVCTS